MNDILERDRCKICGVYMHTVYHRQCGYCEDHLKNVIKNGVTVCSSCGKESCWLGNNFCENYKEAGTVQKHIHFDKP